MSSQYHSINRNRTVLERPLLMMKTKKKPISISIYSQYFPHKYLFLHEMFLSLLNTDFSCRMIKKNLKKNYSQYCRINVEPKKKNCIYIYRFCYDDGHVVLIWCLFDDLFTAKLSLSFLLMLMLLLLLLLPCELSNK